MAQESLYFLTETKSNPESADQNLKSVQTAVGEISVRYQLEELTADGEVIFNERKDDRKWRLSAACRDMSNQVNFFPERERAERAAKQICRRCPVASECLQYALDNRERFGIWGGLNQKEREKLRNRLV